MTRGERDRDRVRRHGVLARVEHWAVALSGIALLFTGIGQMPMYQRYGLTSVPGLAWAGDFLLNLWLHYAAAAVFMAAIAFHTVYHGLRRETAALPRRGDLRESAVILLAMLGLREEPDSDKFLAEQRVAYAATGGAVVLLSVSGALKVARNAGWLFLPPAGAWVVTMLHNLGFAVFLLGLLAHLAAFLLPANRPLLASMATGKVSRAYARRRHPLWVARLAARPAEERVARPDLPGPT
jgi:cytochrome b subunit of formate dehydrogenase